MSAPKGNRYWECRSKHGRNGLWESPDDLWRDCVGYFEWVEDNPLWESKAFNVQGSVTDHALSKMRAMTYEGLYVYLGIHRSTWADYRSKEGFSAVVETVEDVIRDQKFSGAAADLLNPNIISRDLGLVDKREEKQVKSLIDCDDDELDRIICERQQALEKAQRD